MSSELIAIAVGGTDWGTWMRQNTYNTFGWPHIEFPDMGSFMSQIMYHTGVWQKHQPKPPGARNAPPQPPPPIKPLSLLTVLTHGTFEGPIMGSGEGDTLTRARIKGRQGNLAAMEKCFLKEAEVIFGGCVVGLNPWLLADLSVIWGGIKVTGYTTLQKFGNPFYSGDKVTLQKRNLIAGRDTEQGQQYLKRPNDPVRKADLQMGVTHGQGGD